MTIQRPPHRNPGKTAPTHVKSAAGLWRVHDGQKALPDGSSETVIDPATGKKMHGLTYDDARRMKDYAVTKLKLRTVGVVQDDTGDDADSDGESAPVAIRPRPPVRVAPAPQPKPAPRPVAIVSRPAARPVPQFSGEGNPDDTSLELDLPAMPEIKAAPPKAKPVMILAPTTKPNPDPYLEEMRQNALKAAAPAAREAQERADKIKRDRELMRAAGIDPDNVKPPRDPNHPKSAIVGLDPVDQAPAEDTDADDGEDLEQVAAAGNKAQKDDVQRAKEQAAIDAANAEAAGKALFELERSPQSTRTWESLSEEQRGGYRWRALNEHDLLVGDIVAYYTKELSPSIALVVRVFDRNTINLQLDADPETKTANGKMVLNAKRLGDGLDPVPGTWLPAVCADDQEPQADATA